MAAAPCPGAHTEPRFDRKNQIKSPKNVALHLRSATPTQAKSMTYATSTRANCRSQAAKVRVESMDSARRQATSCARVLLTMSENGMDRPRSRPQRFSECAGGLSGKEH